MRSVQEVKEAAENVLKRHETWKQWYHEQRDPGLRILADNYDQVRQECQKVLDVASDCLKHEPQQKHLYLNNHQMHLLFNYTFKKYNLGELVGEI